MIRKLTFDAANVTSNDDSVLYKALGADDRILKGCEITFSTDEIYIAAGYLSAHGRQMKVEGTETIEVMAAVVATPYNLVLEIDMDNDTQEFKAITSDPVHDDISTGSGVYQMLLATFTMTEDGVEGLDIQIAYGDTAPAYPIHATVDEWNIEVRNGSITPNITLPAPKLITSEEIRYIFIAAGTSGNFTAPSGFKLANEDGFSGLAPQNTLSITDLTAGSLYEASFAVLDDTHIGMIIKEWPAP